MEHVYYISNISWPSLDLQSKTSPGLGGNHDSRFRSTPDSPAFGPFSILFGRKDTNTQQGRHGIAELQRLETRNSVRSKVSRVSRAISGISSRRRKAKDRIPFAPLPLSDLSAGVVGWDSQDDPAMPLNFPTRKKWLIVGLLSSITLVTPFASSILAPGIGSLSAEFHNENNIIGAMTVSIYLLGYVIGPLFLAPLSEIYGRKPVLGAANVFFCLWQIGCALAPNISALIVFRFFSGIGGAGCLVSPTRS